MLHNLFDYAEAETKPLIGSQIDIAHAAAVNQFLNLIPGLQDFPSGYDWRGEGKDKATGTTDFRAGLIRFVTVWANLLCHKFLRNLI